VTGSIDCDREGHGYIPAENQNRAWKNSTPPVFGSMRAEKKIWHCQLVLGQQPTISLRSTTVVRYRDLGI
jgi:hypothetical protein